MRHSPIAPGLEYSIRYLQDSELERTPQLRCEWERLGQTSDNLYRLYQMPQWWDHLNATGQGDGLSLAVVRDGTQAAAGIAPLQTSSLAFDLNLFPGLRYQRRLTVINVLGGLPLFPDHNAVFEHFFQSLRTAFPACDGVYLKHVPNDSYLWRYLDKAGWKLPGWLVHCDGRDRLFHSIRCPATFEEYLQKFTAKKRYNFKRQIRLMCEFGKGDFAVRRIADGEQVNEFVQSALRISEHSWKRQIDRTTALEQRIDAGILRDLAGRTLLRSYLLTCSGKPAAYVIGYQDGGVFHYSDIGFDEEFAQFSPGSVLLYLLLEDLYSHCPPQFVNFGIGDSDYKHLFGNSHIPDVSVLLLRKTARHQLLVSASAGLSRLRAFGKRVIRG
jgi:CelD/BcsL family acetyltransferase involved in cellulose biosynthesis